MCCDTVEQDEHDDKGGGAALRIGDETTDVDGRGDVRRGDGEEDAGGLAARRDVDKGPLALGEVVEIGRTGLNEAVACQVGHELWIGRG